MENLSINIFEVLDNYFGYQIYPDPKKMTERRIRELGEHVCQFYEAWEFLPRRNYETRLYLGSFLSSPPFSVEISPYLSSALLHSDSVLLFDPLHYWFYDNQYKRQRLISAPTGWKNIKTLRPDYDKTRKYLSQALPWLSTIRPLVDAGIVVFIPAEQITYQNLSSISQFSLGIEKYLNPLVQFTDKFSPEDITVDDNRKGAFLFAGGNRDVQIQKWIKRGLEHFARDIVISNVTGSLYTAPFKWEQHLGVVALDNFAFAEFQTRLIEAIRNLQLPILSNLTPSTLVKIHNDSGYSNFRASLSDVLRNVEGEIGSPDFAKNVSQIENDILLPKISAINEEVRTSTFQRITNAVLEGVFSFAQTFMGNLPTGIDPETNLKSSIGSGSITVIRELLKRTSYSKDYRIWAQLIPDKPTLSLYGSPLVLKQQSGTRWEIDDRPSMNVKMSAGIVKPTL